MKQVGFNLWRWAASERVSAGKAGIAAALFCLLAMLTAYAPPLAAQSFYGAIVGTVTDSSGAAVPGAAVTVTNIGTNEERSMRAGSTGDYRFVSLIPAVYKIEVKADNFKRVVRTGITVAVDSTPRVDIALEIGAASETVEVTTQAAQLQTESGTIGSQVEGRTVQEMPLNGRNTMNLIALVPGVVPQGSTSGSTSMNGSGGTHTNNAGWSNYAIGGNIAGQGTMYLDGSPMNMLGGNLLGFVPAQDVVQEFKVATNAPAAEFGRFGGGVVEMASKSGTNAWHGSAYEYLRNKVLNANNFFSNRTASSKNGVTSSSTPRQTWNQNQYGVVVSGPVIKDKLFFFFAWENFNSRIGVPASIGTITADMQNGIFRGKKLTDSSGNCTIQYNGTDSTIPSSCIDSTSAVIGGYASNFAKGWFPAPNATLSGGLNYYTVPVVGSDNKQFNVRADYNLSNKQRLFVRYVNLKLDDISQDNFHSYNGWKTGNGFSHYPAQQGVVGDTYTFNPTTILDVRVSYLRQYTDNQPPSLGSDPKLMNSAGWITLGSQLTYNLLPQLAFVGSHSIYSMPAMDNLSFSWLDSYALNASLIKILGKHTLKIGGEARLLDNTTIATSNNDSAGKYTFQNYGSGNYTGDEWANFLLGYPSAATITTTRKAASYNYYQGYYIQDTWEASRKLTLNLGLRWELPSAVSERQDRNTVALPDVTDSTTGAYGTLALVNSAQWNPRSSLESKHHLFAPRLGAAYRLNNSTVIRLAYGLNYLAPDLLTGVLASSSPMNRATTSWNNDTKATYRMSNPFPSAILQPFTRSNFTTYMAATKNQSITSVVPTSNYPAQQQWNVSIARQFKGDVMVEAGYTGATATHLPSVQGLDELSAANINYINTGLSNGTFATPAAALAWGLTKRPRPYYLNYTNAYPLIGTTAFNALQVKGDKRFRNAGLIGVAYTWQKMIGDTDNQNTFLTPGAGWGKIQDYNNMKAERSILSYHIPHRIVISYVLNLPFGKGQKYGASLHGPVGKLISGWSANGITTFQSGQPLSVTDASNYLTTNLGAGQLRAKYTAGCTKTVSGTPYERVTAGKWFNTSCFASPGNFTFGNEPRVDGDLKQQGTNNWDFTMSKTTEVTEKLNVNFRMEFYNIFNHTQFGVVGSSVVPSGWGSQAFGAVSSTANNPRLIQGSLRLNF